MYAKINFGIHRANSALANCGGLQKNKSFQKTLTPDCSERERCSNNASEKKLRHYMSQFFSEA